MSGMNYMLTHANNCLKVLLGFWKWVSNSRVLKHVSSRCLSLERKFHANMNVKRVLGYNIEIFTLLMLGIQIPAGLGKYFLIWLLAFSTKLNHICTDTKVFDRRMHYIPKGKLLCHSMLEVYILLLCQGSTLAHCLSSCSPGARQYLTESIQNELYAFPHPVSEMFPSCIFQ